jgi:hypothetical protein
MDRQTLKREGIYKVVKYISNVNLAREINIMNGTNTKDIHECLLKKFKTPYKCKKFSVALCSPLITIETMLTQESV